MHYIMLGGLLTVYGALVVLMIIQGVKMLKGKKNDFGFTPDQQRMLQKVKSDRAIYERLCRYYRALNLDTRRGRVLNMKGEVLHSGFEIVKDTNK